MTLIAEDLLLLIVDDESGKLTTTTYVDSVLGGALLVELALTEVVEVVEPDSRWARAKVRVRPGASLPADEVLREARNLVAEKDRPAQDLVNRLGKGVRDRLLGRLADRGILRLEEDKVLGLFPRKRWPAVDSTREDEVRRHLAAVLLEGAEPDEHTAALVALLHAIDRAHRTLENGDRSNREVKARAKQVAEGDWAAKAVRDAVAAAQAAMTAVMVASTAGS